MTIATSFNRRLTRCLRSTSAAFERCRPLGANEAAIRPDEERLCADARKSPLKGGTQVFREPFLGPARRQHVAHGPLISSVMLAEVPLAGRSFYPLRLLPWPAPGHGQPLADSSLGCDFGRGSSRSEARAEAGAMCATLEPHASDGVVNSHIPPAPSMSPPAAVRSARTLTHTG